MNSKLRKQIVFVWWNDSGIKYARLIESIGQCTTTFANEFQKSCDNITFHDSIESFFSMQNLSSAEKSEFIETGSVVFDNWKEGKK